VLLRNLGSRSFGPLGPQAPAAPAAGSARLRRLPAGLPPQLEGRGARPPSGRGACGLSSPSPPRLPRRPEPDGEASRPQGAAALDKEENLAGPLEELPEAWGRLLFTFLRQRTEEPSKPAQGQKQPHEETPPFVFVSPDPAAEAEVCPPARDAKEDYLELRRRRLP